VRGQEANGFFIDRQLTGNELLVINAPGCHQQGPHGLHVNFLLNSLVAVDFLPGSRQIQSQHSQKHQAQNQPHFYTQLHGLFFNGISVTLGRYFMIWLRSRTPVRLGYAARITHGQRMLPGGQVVIHRDQSVPEFVDTMMDSTQEQVMIFGFFRRREMEMVSAVSLKALGQSEAGFGRCRAESASRNRRAGLSAQREQCQR
jgi:hypothetical protein